MNPYSLKKIVDRKSGRILANSEIIKRSEYNWLEEILKMNEDNSIDEFRVEKLKEDKKSFFDTQLYKDLYKTAQKEWEFVRLEEDKILECSLCGQKKTKKNYIIKNKLNDKELIVGSSCIDNFRDLRDTSGRKLKDIERELKIQRRRELLNERYIGIIDKIDNWQKNIDEIPTIVQRKFEDEYDNLHKKFLKAYNKYIKSNKIDEKLMEEIYEIVCKATNVIDEINVDIKQKRKSEWFITKEVKDWCFKDYDDNRTVISFLREDGIIKERSIGRIYEEGLIRKVVNRYKEKFNHSDIRVIEYNPYKNTIKVSIRKNKNLYNDRIMIECDYKTFCMDYASVLYKDEKWIEAKEFALKNGKIVDKNSLEQSIMNFKNLLRGNEYTIKDYNMDYNEIIFYNGKVYYKVNLIKFINNFLIEVFEEILEEKSILKINNYIRNNSEIIDYKEYLKDLENREKQEEKLVTDYSKFI